MDKLARSTCVAVVPGSAWLLLRLGAGKAEDDALCKGWEDEADLVVFMRELVRSEGVAELGRDEEVEDPSFWTGLALDPVFVISCGC